MATLRQKRVAKRVVENLSHERPESAQKVLESEGYGKSLQNHPKRVLESQGVQEELITLGFDPDTAKSVVREILIGGENDTVKLKAADMVFKVHGTYAAEKHVNLNINEESTQRTEELADRLGRLLGR